MSEVIFYTNPQSRGRIVRWMLEEAGAPYRTEVVAYGAEMKSEPYISINPMGKVPAIVHQGEAVTECAAIIAYLADAFAEAALAPPPARRQAYYRWLFFAAGPLEAAVTNHALGFDTSEEQSRMAGYGSYDLVVETLAAALGVRPFITGEQFCAADVYLASHVGWGLQFGTLPDRPAFRDYFSRASSREAYSRAAALDDALIQTPAADPV